MTVRASVLGADVSASLSPAIHQFVAAREGVVLDFQAEQVDHDGFLRALARTRFDPEWFGHSVTAPFKDSALREVDVASAEAVSVGAVNCIRKVGKRLEGHNTDVVGFARALDRAGYSPEGATCAIVGAGGGAAAVATALAHGGATSVALWSRNHRRAARLAARMKLRHPGVGWSVGLPTRVGLLVHATSARTGLDEHLAAVLGDMQAELSFDLHYRPGGDFSLLRPPGSRLEGGLSMLVEQALAAWGIWFGYPIAGDEVRRALVARLEAIELARQGA